MESQALHLCSGVEREQSVPLSHFPPTCHSLLLVARTLRLVIFPGLLLALRVAVEHSVAQTALLSTGLAAREALMCFTFQILHNGEVTFNIPFIAVTLQTSHLLMAQPGWAGRSQVGPNVQSRSPDPGFRGPQLDAHV